MKNGKSWAVLENIEEGYYEVDLKGNYRFCNEAYSKILGVSKQKIIGRNYKEFLGEATGATYQTFHKVFLTGIPSKASKRKVVRPDGSQRDIEYSVSLIKDKKGRPFGFRGIVRDETEKNRIEENLRQSEERYRTILENIEDGYHEVDLKGNFIFFNEAFQKIMGYTQEELLEMNYSRYTDRENTQKILTAYNQVYRTGKPLKRFEWEIIRKDGARRNLAVSVSLIRDASNQPTGFQGIARDETDRKEAEQALRASEAKFRVLVEHLPQSIFMKDLNSVYITCNQNYSRDLGIEVEDITGKTDFDFHPPDLAEKYRADDRQVMTAGTTKTFEEKYLHFGNEIWIRTTSAPYRDVKGDIVGVIGIFEDITERKKAEQEQQRLANEIRLLLESTGEGIIGVDSNGRCSFINKAGAETLGYLSEEFLGKNIHRSIHHSHPDGSNYAEEDCPMVAAFRKGENCHWDEDVLWRKDGNCFWADYSSYPIIEKKEVKGAVIVFRDITERKRIKEQVRILGHQLLKAQEDERRKLSRELHDTIGQNLLALKMSLDSHCVALAERVPEFKPKALELSRFIQQTVQDVRDMAHYLRPSSLEQLGLVEASLQYCEEFSATTHIEVDFSATGINESQFDYDTKITLYRLIQEGLNNIKKHSGASQVTIRLVSSFPNIILRVEDNGKGFDVNNWFDLAVKEKRLGLISMEERVSMLRGQMKIESQPGKGTKILIEVPSQGDIIWPTGKKY